MCGAGDSTGSSSGLASRSCDSTGAGSEDRLAEALGALELQLTADELAAIEAAVPAAEVAGDRYDEHGMATLDSERRA